MSALQKAVSYPALAHDAGIEGRVLVSFTVGETGDVQDLRVRKGVHETLNAAAIEAVESVSFNPAEKNGAPTAMEMTLPIRFALPDEETETN
jgi:protein TonB